MAAQIKGDLVSNSMGDGVQFSNSSGEVQVWLFRALAHNLYVNFVFFDFWQAEMQFAHQQHVVEARFGRTANIRSLKPAKAWGEECNAREKISHWDIFFQFFSVIQITCRTEEKEKPEKKPEELCIGFQVLIHVWGLVPLYNFRPSTKESSCEAIWDGN